MSGSVRLLLTILIVVFVGWFAIRLIVGIITSLLALVVPLLVVGGVAVVLYSVINRKSLGGGRRTLP